MPRTSKETGSRPNGPTTFPFKSAEAFQETCPLLARASAIMVDRAITIMQSYLDFLKRRLEQDRTLVVRLGKLNAPAQTVFLWAEFFRTAQQDYLEEVARSIKCSVESALEAAVEAKERLALTAALAARGSLVTWAKEN